MNAELPSKFSHLIALKEFQHLEQKLKRSHILLKSLGDLGQRDVTEAPKSKITFLGITFVRTSEANLPNLDFGLTYFLGLLNSLPLSGSSWTKRLPCGRQVITRAYL